MLFKKLALKCSAHVLGDYAIQGAEIAGADCIHGQLRNSTGKMLRVDPVVSCGSSGGDGSWSLGSSCLISFCKRDLDLVTWSVLFIKKREKE